MSSKPADLELLRSIFKDDRLHIAVGQIISLHMASDRSVLRVKVKLYPDEHELIARMAWESVGPNAGFFQLPSPGDMVLIGQAEGEVDQAFVLRRLTSKEDTIPAEAANGDLVARSLAGKKARLISDMAVWLSKPGSTPTENVVLGQVFKQLMIDLLDKIQELTEAVGTHTHMGNLGIQTPPPIEAPDFLQLSMDFSTLKSSPVEDEAVLSDLAFTEKG